MSDDISNSADTLDVRDLIERFEALEEEQESFLAPASEQEADGGKAEWDATPEGEEMASLGALLEDLEGNGGDHEWRGSWYPVTLIRHSYWVEYAQELAEDVGAIPDDAAWPCNCIDWDKAADELKVDYLESDFDGVTYYYR